MIVLQRVAELIKELGTETVSILRALESLSKRFEYIPLEEVVKKTGLNPDDILFRLGYLSKEKLIQRQTIPYIGYRLVLAGYDALALHALASKDIIVSIGQPLGTGKEATVYQALNGEGKEVALKFLRWGRTSFRQARRLRSLPATLRKSWIDYCKQAAEREYAALHTLTFHKVRVPTPIAVNRHILVMTQMEGNLLIEVRDLTSPQQVLNQILAQIRIAFQDAKIVHGDLSEYNVIIDEEDQTTIFDWPQWVSLRHPNALLLLRRDISYIVNFFRRRFRLAVDSQEAYQNIVHNNGLVRRE